jgi:glycerophosphoryl diester phosphodiesterase
MTEIRRAYLLPGFIILVVIVLSGCTYTVQNLAQTKQVNAVQPAATTSPPSVTASQKPGIAQPTAQTEVDPHFWTTLDSGLVTHAAGGIDGIEGTNSYEALVENYKLGHKVFEIDLNLTTDGRLVAVHDWAGYSGPKSSAEFKDIKIKDRFTSMSLEDVLDFMVANPDLYLVTDTKSFEYTDEQIVIQFTELYQQANKRGATVLDRIVPQIYNQKMYTLIKGVYDFKSVIYTLYASPDNDAQVVEFVKDKPDIRVITMGPVRYSDQFKADLDAAGKLIYFFTLNDPEEIKGYKNKRAHGFYTDFVTAQDIG